ncbi:MULTISPECIES: hypothetical protein [unclassified Microbulbifer]|uniref:hypothetical protein n=1 Tax=unclassified Microbulbifer TaxID=2619833 RepID=UPI0027E45089|nr:MULTISPECIES: hypothetical protein [unclassified Microbulbifer]
MMKNLSEKKLYLHCEECEQGWNKPEDVPDIKKSSLTLLEDFNAEIATENDTQEFGWAGYDINHLKKNRGKLGQFGRRGSSVDGAFHSPGKTGTGENGDSSIFDVIFYN